MSGLVSALAQAAAEAAVPVPVVSVRAAEFQEAESVLEQEASVQVEPAFPALRLRAKVEDCHRPRLLHILQAGRRCSTAQ